MLTIAQNIEKFLQVDNLVCAYDGKDLGRELRFFQKKPSYFKMKLFPQSPWFSWRWLKQVYLGDDYVLRFCDFQCFVKLMQRGGPLELETEKALI